MKRKKSMNFILPVAVILFAALASYGATTAYLSDSPGEVLNVITTGSVDVELEEENWRPEDNTTVLPKEKVIKDPAVKNTGKNDARVFLQVDIPMKNISVVDGITKMKTERGETELFTFVPDETIWELILREQSGENMRYVYGYREVLKPGQETEVLFSEVTAVNYLEGNLSSEMPYHIQVTALAAQENVQSTDMAEIYQEFFRQEETGGKGETI